MEDLPNLFLNFGGEVMEIAHLTGYTHEAPTHILTEETLILLGKAREMLKLAKDSLKTVGLRGSLH